MTPDVNQRARLAFQTAWGRPPARLVQAPGRVNLIGEHTDYNDGFVLPCAIDRGTVVACRPRADTLVRVVAADWQHEADQFDLAAPITPRTDAAWPNYVRGVARELLAAGLPLRGLDLAIAGDVPSGAGLSSSASLEVALVQAWRTVQGLALEPTRMALVAQAAENRFVGCACGIMDQLISARGEAGHALLIDCRSLQARAVALPARLALLIVESRVRRGLLDSEYNTRRGQCEQAAAALGVRALRDVELPQLQAAAHRLDPLVFQRARHIVTENARTLAAADALAAGDLRTLGALMAASHASMRDDFEITHPAVDRLAALLQEVAGSDGGARMTGGGFGGCVVALLPEHRVNDAIDAVRRGYRSPEGEPARVHRCRAAAGSHALD